MALVHDRCVLLHGVAFPTMRQILGPKSVDTIITDPPYGEHTHKMLGREQRDDGHEARAALTFAHLTAAEIAELAELFVTLSKGWIIVFTDDRSVDAWGTSLEAAGGRWVRTGHWVKTNPMPQMTGDRPAVGTEPIVIGHTGMPPGSGRMKWRGGGRAATWRGPRDTDGFHPNQKPAWLMQELAGLFVPPGGVVLDPFCGSGSTGVGALSRERFAGEVPTETACKACAKKHGALKMAPMPEGLEFIGIERDIETVEIARKRLELALR